MQHQYWVTKKSVLRKLGGKEDECIVASDAELDAKLELFKSINETCIQLQRVIDLYQERLCYLAQEENALGRYLKECGKNEKNASAGQIMAIAGKALAYTGHQRLMVRSPLVRLHHEVETFRGRGISDTRATVSEMEKSRTEYRAALSWMKSASSQLDPDSGHGLERFRKAQAYVKKTKTKFDRLTLACLQKVDLLAAARCNMFSHALVPYQSSIQLFSSKASETLTLAAAKLDKVEPYDLSTVVELAGSPDKDRSTFFKADYTDQPKADEPKKEIGGSTDNQQTEKNKTDTDESVSNLLGDYFPTAQEEVPKIDDSKPSSALLDLQWPTTSNFSTGSFMPSSFIQDGMMNLAYLDDKKDVPSSTETEKKTKHPKPSETQMSWLSLFSELDPLASAITDNNVAGDRA